MTRPLTPEEEATMRGCDEQDFASDSEPMRLWATLDAEREKVRVLREHVALLRGVLTELLAVAPWLSRRAAVAALATTEPKP